MTHSCHKICLRFLATAATAALLGCAATDQEGFGLEPMDSAAGVDYVATVLGAPDEDTKALLESSLKLFTLAERRPSSMPRLARRAEADMDTAIRVLRSEGYYASEARFEIVEGSAAEPPAASEPENPADRGASSDQQAPPGPSVQVSVMLTPGERFSLADMSVVPATTSEGLAVAPPSQFGVLLGSPARAAQVIDAEARMLSWLANRGYPYARFTDRTSTLNLEKHTLTVVSQLEPGPQIRFGELRFEGLESVDAGYLASYQPWKEGEVYSESSLDRMQAALFATSLFDFVSVEPPPREAVASPADAAHAPMTVRAAEGKHRSVGAGARFSTGEGPEATAFLEHRNLFGANETGRISVLGGLNRQELNLTFRKPQFLHEPQVLFANLQLRHEDDEAFEERTVELTAGIERRINKRLTLSGALSVEFSEIDDDLDGDFDTARLLGAPLIARYDASNNLLDPTRGYRLSARVTPYTGSYIDKTLLFTVLDVTGSVYFPIDDAARYVLALRGRAGTLIGAERDDLPSTKRLYSGGGGSVRGYEERFIGPLDERGDPVGGRSVLEGGIELRARLGENLGLVPFLEAGTVSESIFPDFEDDVQIGAGLGVRYYTLIGPIRADVAFPINRREEDDLFQFYVSIGQAF